jgi:hypothetical protein
MKYGIQVLSASLALIGCGGGAVVQTFDDAAVADAAEAPDAAVVEDAGSSCETTPTYEELRDTIFAPRCATGRCHGGTDGEGRPQGPNDFTSSSTRLSFVDRASVFGAGVLVRPGDPEASFLLRKLTNDLPPDARLQGVAMPLSSSGPWVPLPESDIERIRCWIEGGAP